MARDRARQVAIEQGLGIRPAFARERLGEVRRSLGGGGDWGLALIATLVAIVAFADPQGPQPTFRSEINYVQIPVRVLDARGDFVRGLTQSDFQILEDGQPQRITAFSAVDIQSRDVDPTVPNAPLASVDTVASNDPIEIDGRVYVFVLDNQTMSPAIALRTRHVVRGFVRDYLEANDIAAVVFTGAGRGQHFTRNAMTSRRD